MMQDKLVNAIKNRDVQRVKEFFSSVSDANDASITDLETPGSSGNTALSPDEMIRRKNELLTTPALNNKIPVQVACATSHEDMTRYLYDETPENILNGDHGFHLLEECITKKMFDITLDLLKIFPGLASYRCPSSSTSIISTLAQTPSLFRGRDKLVFWKGWIYNRLTVEIKYIKFKPQSVLADVGIVEDQQSRTDVQQRPGEETSRLKRLVSKLLKFLWAFVRSFSILLSVPLSLSMMIPALVAAAVAMAVATPVVLMYRIIRVPVSKMKEFLTKPIRALKWMDLCANEVLISICERLSNLPQDEFAQSGAVEATFQAIKNGIPEIAIKIIEKTRADILWSSTDPEDSGNLFLCAVAHRQEKVAGFLYGFDASKYTITKTNMVLTSDEEGNNVLHLAAKLAPLRHLDRISGAALQLQSERRWFKAVESIVPRFYDECKNKDDETPSQVFAREHKVLLKEAEEWMKKTAESSTVVGALIITIMFAAAFTVPGGNDQTSGFPIFLPKNPVPFMIFILSDAISLFAASSSVLMFLGILTSRYAYEDFLKYLPIKLIIGLSSLFISIATMTTAFCAAVFIMLQDHLWGAILITLLACIPVTFFALLQFPLLVEIYSSTYSPDIFGGERPSLISKLRHDKDLHAFVRLLVCFLLLTSTLVYFTVMPIKRLTRGS